MDAIHTMLSGAVAALSVAIAALWRHGQQASRSEKFLETENARLLVEMERKQAEYSLELEREIRRTAEAIRERRDVMAFIVPIFLSDRIHLKSPEQAALREIMKGVDS